MSVCSIAGNTFSFTLLCACLSLSHGLKSKDDTVNSDRGYAAVLNDMDSTAAGGDLQDAKMTDLAHSIQAAFNFKMPDVKAVKPVDKVATTTGTSVHSTVEEKQPKPEKKLAKAHSSSDHPAELEKQPEPEKKLAKGHSSSDHLAELVKHSKLAEKPEKVSSAPVKLSHDETRKPYDHANVPQAIKKQVEGVHPTVKHQVDGVHQAIEGSSNKEVHPLSKALSNATDATRQSFQPNQKPAKVITSPEKRPLSKVGQFKVVVVSQNKPQTEVEQINASAKAEPSNKTIEEAVVSLPMASFALGDNDNQTASSKNQTEVVFPGNATQKAAWDQKEKVLEKEVEILKARLANASDTLKPAKLVSKPQAPNASKAQVSDGAGKQSVKFMAAKEGPAKSAAKEVSEKATGEDKSQVHEATAVTDAAISKEAEEQRTEDVTAVTPSPKKVASIIALGTEVSDVPEGETAAISSDNRVKEPVYTSHGTWSWFASVISWFSSFFSFDQPPTPVSSEMVVAPRATAAAALHKAKRVWNKQSSTRTALEAQEEHEHIFTVSDAWQQKEEEDTVVEDTVRREDVADRRRAEEADLPHRPSKEELQGRHGAQMSAFWSKLEEEDNNIEQTVRSDDLVKYAQLTQEQDTRVNQASDQLRESKVYVEQGNFAHKIDSRVAIHEPWLRRENRDKDIERQIHDSPDLQMLQLKHSHRHM